MYKQVILVIHGLKMGKGKIAAQSAHASVEAVHRSNEDMYKQWRTQGMPKIVVKVQDQKELYKYIQEAKDEGLTTAVITDAGRTCVAPGTVTCGAIGPALEEDIDRITGKLSLL